LRFSTELQDPALTGGSQQNLISPEAYTDVDAGLDPPEATDGTRLP